MWQRVVWHAWRAHSSTKSESVLDCQLTVSWRYIPISLIVSQKGEQTAQACAMACFQQLSHPQRDALGRFNSHESMTMARNRRPPTRSSVNAFTPKNARTARAGL
jgi:hypothetical protein